MTSENSTSSTGRIRRTSTSVSLLSHPLHSFHPQHLHQHQYQLPILIFLVLSLVSFHSSPVESLPVPVPVANQQHHVLTRFHPNRSDRHPNNLDYLGENQHQQDASEAVSSSLSIVSPLEVLRQTLAAEIKKNRIRQATHRRIASNDEYIRRIGR